MRTPRQRRRRRLVAGAVVLSVAALGALLVEDWSRDFTEYEASIDPEAVDPDLRPLVSAHTVDQLAAAVRGATHGMPDWRPIGEVGNGRTVLLVFVRTHRLLRVQDDITVRIEDAGDRRVLTAESRSRLHVGDLGRNPRNLRRLLREVRTVLEAGTADGTV